MCEVSFGTTCNFEKRGYRFSHLHKTSPTLCAISVGPSRKNPSRICGSNEAKSETLQRATHMLLRGAVNTQNRVVTLNFKRELTVTGVCVAQGLLGVQADANVSSAGGGGAVTGACPLVVAATAAHRALRPGRPAGPSTFHCNTHTHTQSYISLSCLCVWCKAAWKPFNTEILHSVRKGNPGFISVSI